MFERIDSNFYSSGTKCAGWLYLPTKVQKPPIIVMAHGFAAERTFALPKFAERFAKIILLYFSLITDILGIVMVSQEIGLTQKTIRGLEWLLFHMLELLLKLIVIE